MEPHWIGTFPTWLPGTAVALYHEDTQITTDIPNYIWNASHIPPMHKYLIERSKTATGHESKWTDDIFDNIAWQYSGDVICGMTIGQQIQISKFVNDMLPTTKRLQTFNNKHDGRCFTCQQLWEDTNHIIKCQSDEQYQARKEAMNVLCKKLHKQHTPNVLTDILCDSMDHWINQQRITPPQWHNNVELVLQAITTAFYSQKKIGWDQFFRGRISSDWTKAIRL